MTVTRAAALVLLVALTPRADANPFWAKGKGKSDAQVRTLVATLRTDPDEKRRRAAVAELRDADPRTQADVIPALVATVQRDPAAFVRADAADVLGGYRMVFPLAGSALESAAEADPAAVVRDVAKQALWEYHLLGYRSARGADGFHGQTAEPPVAAKPQPRPAVPVVVPVRVDLPSVPQMTAPTTVSAYRPTPPPELPAPAVNGPRIVFTTAPPAHLNLTAEPPLARR